MCRGHGREFGSAVNPRAILDQGHQLDFYDGGGLDCAFLSFAEVDVQGNVNVSRYAERFPGSGGFMNITQSTRRLVFSGTLTGGGLDAAVRPDGLALRAEGRLQRFVPAVEQVTFSGRRARERGQHVTFVTERTVFELMPEGLVLTELAPGIRLQEDVRDRMGFVPQVHPSLRAMPAPLFRTGPMGMRAAFLQRAPRRQRAA